MVSSDVVFPNGMAITPDGKTLIIAETLAARLSSFEIDEATGDLGERKLWASMPWHAVPGESALFSSSCCSCCIGTDLSFSDGLCLDAGGGVWFASLSTKECIRIEEGGRVTHRVRTTQPPFACMLGGEDGRVLFICTAPSHHREKCVGVNQGKVEACKEAPYPRAGWP